VKKLLPLFSLALFCVISNAQNSVLIETPKNSPTNNPVNPNLLSGQKLFLKNCAHCHGADAHGDDGPDLHRLDEADEWITNRIRNGKKGQMTAFAGKLQPAEIAALVAYLHTLK
jgi:mono/diheme cytochrome c family protein